MVMKGNILHQISFSGQGFKESYTFNRDVKTYNFSKIKFNLEVFLNWITNKFSNIYTLPFPTNK